MREIVFWTYATIVTFGLWAVVYAVGQVIGWRMIFQRWEEMDPPEPEPPPTF